MFLQYAIRATPLSRVCVKVIEVFGFVYALAEDAASWADLVSDNRQCRGRFDIVYLSYVGGNENLEQRDVWKIIGRA